MKHSLSIIGLVAFICCPSLIHSQVYSKKINPFVVEHYGRMLPYAFFGGMYVPKSEFVDMDGDQDRDLLITQVDGRITYFENDGTRFIFITDHFDSLDVGNWSRFVDLDGDGDRDLLAGSSSSTMNLYENIGGIHQPRFVLKESEVKDSSNNSILTENQSIPYFADIDADGDLDFFTGRSIGSLALYENIGTSSQHLFKFVTDQFEDILIISAAKPNGTERHGASGIVFHDINGDQDLDLFWGDFFSRGMYYLENKGSRFLPDFPEVTTDAFPDTVLSTLGFNVPGFADIDGDGDEDLFVNVLYRDQELDNFWLFINTGTSFEFYTKNIIEGIDVGRSSHPALADIDGDGDRDLFIGSYQGKIIFYRNTTAGMDIRFSLDTTLVIPIPAGEFISAPAFADIDNDGDLDCFAGTFKGKILFFQNAGDVTHPDFILISDFYQGIDIGNYSAPVFSDIDNDGDRDLFAGEEDGTINFFMNIGTPMSAQFDAPVLNYFGITGKGESVPEILDYDHDGDMDCFVGYKDGSVSYFENRGHASIPDFALISDSFQGLKATQNAVPRFIDMDGDNDSDLLMGNLRGGIEYYEAGDQTPLLQPVGDKTTFVDSVFVFYVSATGNPTPSYALENAPSNMTINSHSGRIFWRPSLEQAGNHNVTIRASNAIGSDLITFNISVISDVPETIVLFQNYPNPFNTGTVIRFDLYTASKVVMKVYNLLGQDVKTLVRSELPAGHHQTEWDGTDNLGRQVSSGLYFYRLQSGRQTKIKKMLLIK
jgi:hypothetical protein